MNINGQKLENYMDVLQVCDSTFPIGTFNHSFGMENYIRTDRVTNTDEFELWLDTYLKTQFKYGEGLLIALCFDALEKNEIEKIWTYDSIITCSSQASETRNGTKMIAKQMIDLVQTLHCIPLLTEYKKLIREDQVYGNPAIVFSIFAHFKGLEVQEAILLYGYSINSTMIQNAVRAVPLGQKSGQLILKRTFALLESIVQEIETLDSSYLGANVPGIELSQIQHEVQIFRLFMS
ncbi:urease accessory protein UreF [Candidatus Enterococcus ferrettii]|uniref:Urease accessory protein UreF n=1 Tax=Candidatus Enterococcus ferrettii TaxID=2815324 RepID=A0ABV0EPT6_9ENTE|nr:urease accessory protein UreF [Enterococcus sp. 665A]MBO1342586.1 urease accessory protein UreF [Enterococcus sp. 665A]